MEQLNGGRNLIPDEIPLDEIKNLAEESMEENILILQALADQDRRDTTRPWKASLFYFDPRYELNATTGTISGTIQIPIQGSNYPSVTSEFWQVEKARSVST